MSGCLEISRNGRLCAGALAYEDRIEELQQQVAEPCQFCGGDELTAHICKQFAFRADVAALQIRKLQQQVDEQQRIIDGFMVNASLKSNHIEQIQKQVDALRPYLRHHEHCDRLMPTLNPAEKSRPCNCGLAAIKDNND